MHNILTTDLKFFLDLLDHRIPISPIAIQKTKDRVKPQLELSILSFTWKWRFLIKNANLFNLFGNLLLISMRVFTSVNRSYLAAYVIETLARKESMITFLRKFRVLLREMDGHWQFADINRCGKKSSLLDDNYMVSIVFGVIVFSRVSQNLTVPPYRVTRIKLTLNAKYSYLVLFVKTITSVYNNIIVCLYIDVYYHYVYFYFFRSTHWTENRIYTFIWSC